MYVGRYVCMYVCTSVCGATTDPSIIIMVHRYFFPPPDTYIRPHLPTCLHTYIPPQETAIRLAQLGARVLIAVRNPEKVCMYVGGWVGGF